MEKLGGSLQFMSRPNEGTIFYFSLPLFKSAQLVTNKNELSNVNDPKLLICGNENQANHLRSLLQAAGLKADVTSSITAAKELLKQNNYGALLIDVAQPNHEGITFIRELRDSYPTSQLPIIVLSLIKTEDTELGNGDAVVVVDWLDNPPNIKKLIKTISQVKKQHAHLNALSLPSILHIEDDKDTQHVVASILENKAKVTQAASIRETIQRLGHENFDLVILDLLLPDGNGSDLLPILSKYQLPIVVYSAYELDRAYAGLVSDALVKSKISNEALLTTILNALDDKIKEDVTID